MSENSVPNYTDTCAAIRQRIQDNTVRIRVSEQNVKLKETYDNKLYNGKLGLDIANNIIAVLKPLAEDTLDYIDLKRKESMMNINNAIRLAGEIIQDASEGIFFQIENGEAWLSTPDGLEVDATEGAGFRQISSTFIRSVVLGANPDTLNTMFCDEIFSLVSLKNSATLSLYLNVMCKDMQIISIEQKPQVYSNIDSVQYLFSKNDNYAEVTRSEVKNGGNDDLQNDQVV